MAANLGATTPDVTNPDDEGQADGCLCGAEIYAADVTPDDQLPVAAGGVAALPLPDVSDDDIDGCDAAANAVGVTADEVLPVAVGGVS
jgi:hypothetical protein